MFEKLRNEKINDRFCIIMPVLKNQNFDILLKKKSS